MDNNEVFVFNRNRPRQRKQAAKTDYMEANLVADLQTGENTGLIGKRKEQDRISIRSNAPLMLR